MSVEWENESIEEENNQLRNNKRQRRNESEEEKRIPGPAGTLMIENESSNWKNKNENGENKSGNRKGGLIKNKLMVGNGKASNGINTSFTIDEDFRKGPWLNMCLYNRLFPFQNQKKHQLQTNIQRILKGGFSNFKSKYLAVILKKITPTDTDSHVELKDPTGEMEGTMHRAVVDLFPGINTGTVLAIKNFSVFSTRPHKHYINITAENISKVYTTGQFHSIPAEWDPQNEYDPLSIYDYGLIGQQFGQFKLNEILESMQNHQFGDNHKEEEPIPPVQQEEEKVEDYSRIQHILEEENQEEEELE
eukprot:TRINITY_DN303_c0_g1_i1.p2 TRINITY_DN303_c0_g1~~TRINITY_DN303_c0_g1_i1.p2  ORF type:complete len:305 (+),score=109.02 TRINITY_DN303_c0_g1_i1:88-1002(+)